MRKQVLILFAVVFTTLLGSSSVVSAKRLLPQLRPVSNSATSSTSKYVVAKLKIRGDRHAVTGTFTNLVVAKSIDYILTYKTNGIEQAAVGSVAPGSPEPQTRELLLGTCSSGTCRYDTNVTDTKFVVTSILKSGQKVIKTFKIKI